MAADELRILRRTQQLLKKARRILPGYGRGAQPVQDEDMLRFASQLHVHVEAFQFQSSDPALLLPPYQGRTLLLINKRYERPACAFALRHELAHVLAGDADGLVFLAEDGYMADGERAADMFALTDMLPSRVIEDALGGESRLESDLEDLRALLEPFKQEWSEERIQDRLRLRWSLFCVDP